MEEPGTRRYDMLAEAAAHLRAALTIIDALQVSAHIGAHLDLALSELEAKTLAGGAAAPRALKGGPAPRGCNAA